jgi:hypothetical protein
MPTNEFIDYGRKNMRIRLSLAALVFATAFAFATSLSLAQESPPPANPEGTAPTAPSLVLADVVTLHCIFVQGGFGSPAVSGPTDPYEKSPHKGQPMYSATAAIGIAPDPLDAGHYYCDRDPKLTELGPYGPFGKPVKLTGATVSVWTKDDSEKMLTYMRKQVLAAIQKAIQDNLTSKQEVEAAVTDALRKQRSELKAELRAEILGELKLAQAAKTEPSKDGSTLTAQSPKIN